MEISLGATKLEVRNYIGEKCLFFGKHRCIHPKLIKKEKAKEKSERCKGKNKACPEYHGKAPHSPIFDEKYILPKRETELLALALQTGQNTLIVGSPGVGKSSLVTQIASIANWGVIKFSCSEETTSSKILGQWVIHDKQMVWVDGYITYAMKNGLILLEDEADFMRPELRGELHSVMEHGGTLTLSKINQETGKSFQEVIHKHPNFRWISTANTVGYGDDLFAFHGTQFFNAASRDRYEIILNIEYRTKEQEALVIISKTNIDEETCKKMVSVADSCRKESQTMTFQFSTRRLLSWANLIVTGISPTVAAKIAVLNFANKTDAHTIKSLMISHMGLEF